MEHKGPDKKILALFQTWSLLSEKLSICAPCVKDPSFWDVLKEPFRLDEV